MGTIEYIITDMGNGGAYCSECECCLDGGNPLVKVPSKCPECGINFVDSNTYINMGGSDF